jgi:ABC-type Fe3+ transport system substrate-binding protein
MAASRQRVLAQSFVDFLVSREGQTVLARLGFQPVPPGAR